VLPVRVSLDALFGAIFERVEHTGNDDKLGLAGTEGLQRRLVSEDVLSGLHHKRQARVDGVGTGLLGLLDRGHLCTSVGDLLKGC
jgi:hypothetical protein